MNSVRTFQHKFKGGITCEVTVDLDKLITHGYDYLVFQWSGGQPKLRDLPEYRHWLLSVGQSVSNEAHCSILHPLEVGKHTCEIWVFESGRAPQLVDTLSKQQVPREER